jgi:hypothetical protein
MVFMNSRLIAAAIAVAAIFFAPARTRSHSSTS